MPPGNIAVSDRAPDERSPLTLVAGTLGLVIGAGSCAILATAALMLPREGGNGGLSFLILGLPPIGGFLGWQLGVSFGQYIRRKVGTHEGPVAAGLVVVFAILLLGWLVMEFYGGW